MMKKRLYLLLVLIGILGSCNKPEKSVNAIDDLFEMEQEQIRNLIRDIFETAKAKDMDNLDSYHLKGPKFSKFDDGDIPQRQDYEMAKKSEEDFFTNITEFDYKLPDIKVDVFDDMAIATFILDYGVIMEDETFNGNSRSTLVFVQDEGQWRIVHEHFSPFISTSQ